MPPSSERVSRPDQLRDGLAVIDKAAGWTSSDVVVKARGILHNKKVGHSGTLDPGATGVLLLGVGRVTRLLRFLTALPKSYVGEIVLGTETTTLDDQGEVVATYDMASVTDEQVADITSHLGPEDCYAFVQALSVVETFQRACLTLGIESIPDVDRITRFAPGESQGVTQ